MILAHLSDLHLGHRAFDRWDEGVNLRERDFSLAFQRAVDDVIAQTPDVVVVTGDVFDRPDPPPGALVTLARGLEALHLALPGVPVHLVAGARDTARRRGDAGALAALDAFPHVEAATTIPRSIFYEEHDLHVLLVPHRSVLRGPQPLIEPDPRARWNVLATCGRVARGEGPGLQIDPSGWDYIALGGRHTFGIVSPRVAYAGSLERVGSTPWREAGEEKGFAMVDLHSGDIRLRGITGRPVVALATTRAPAGDAQRLRNRFAEVVREVPGGIARKIVRVRLRGPAPSDLIALQGLLSDFDRSAIHLSVEVEDPGGLPTQAVDLADRVRSHLEGGAGDAATGLLDRVLEPAVAR